MKRFNTNILIFVVASLLVLGGFGRAFAAEMYASVKSLNSDVARGETDAIKTFTKNVEKGTSEGLRYHDQLMDINSLKERFLGSRIMDKGNELIVRTSTDSLVKPTGQVLTEKQADKIAAKVKRLQVVSEENGANFLYLAAPIKAYYGGMPANVEDYSKANHDTLVQGLKAQDIPCLDFSTMLHDGSYYRTDHHWTAATGLQATGAICETLKTNYGFTYDVTRTDLSAFEIKTYPSWFLGSYGKKTGTFFAKGADDFQLITPKFETDFTEQQPFKKLVHKGSFAETLIYTENLEKDYYGISNYAAYSGGDFRLQIMKNNLLKEGKKVVLVRDSFACVVSPFLALQTSELHICDVRNYSYYVGTKMNMEEYIKQVRPDYVLVLYSGASDASGKYDFF